MVLFYCRTEISFFTIVRAINLRLTSVAVKRGISREAAELYPFDETRQALYEGAKRAVAAIPKCKPYKLSLPIKAKKEYLVFDSPSAPGRKISKEGTIEDVLKLMDF